MGDLVCLLFEAIKLLLLKKGKQKKKGLLFSVDSSLLIALHKFFSTSRENSWCRRHVLLSSPGIISGTNVAKVSLMLNKVPSLPHSLWRSYGNILCIKAPPDSSLVLALSSHDSQCSKWNEGAPRRWLGCGHARVSLDVPERIGQEPQSLLKYLNSCTRSNMCDFLSLLM